MQITIRTNPEIVIEVESRKDAPPVADKKKFFDALGKPSIRHREKPRRSKGIVRNAESPAIVPIIARRMVGDQ